MGAEIRWRPGISVVGARGHRPVRRVTTEPTPDSPQAGFQVRLSNFEGPFDLLLQLIFAHRLDVTEVALHRVTDDFIAYTKAIGPQMGLDETTAFLVIAATLLDLKAARLLPSGDVARRRGPRAARGARPAVRPAAAVPGVQARRGDVRRTRGRRAAQLPARRCRWRIGSPTCCPRSCWGWTPQSFAQIAATTFTPRPVPTVGTDHLHEAGVSVPEQAQRLLRLLEHRGRRTVGDVLRPGGRLRGCDRDRGPIPGAARTVSGPGGSIRPSRTAWCAASFVDRRSADQRALGHRGGRRLMTEDISDDIAQDLEHLDASTGSGMTSPPGDGGRRARCHPRGAAAGGGHPGARGVTRGGHRTTGLPRGGQAEADGRRAGRPRQRDRAARGRRRLAHVHACALRAVRRAAPARRGPVEADPGGAGDAGRGRLPAAGHPGAGQCGARRERRRGDADVVGARADHRGRRRSPTPAR